MKRRTKVLAAAAASLTALGALAAAGAAGPSIDLTPVTFANAKVAGRSAPNLVSPELQDVAWAKGSNPVENPSNNVVAYGYLGTGTFLPVPRSFVSPTPGPPSVTIGQATPVEAQKTEPDKNTYLVLDHQKGADPNYDYGRHFLFQGHEAGTPGYITRINLDADGPHRVTLMATKVATPSGVDSGANLPTIDGSTWDPWANRLLFTAESAAPAGGVWQGTLDVPSSVDDLRAWLGSGAYEGIQNDDRGSLYIVEDAGGTTTNSVRRPNSFVYRFLPKDPSDPKQGGTIQALQVLGKDGQPITFTDGNTAVPPTGLGPNPPKYVDLHTYGSSFKTKWVDLATTTSSSTMPGPDVNALAKSEGATPFKRPENGAFQPGSKFRMLYFTETGDTSASSAATSSGGFGALFALKQDPTSNDGSIGVLYNGDLEHAAFDNLTFFSDNQLGVVEDRGDSLHGQQPNGLDSAWRFDLTADYSKQNAPVRFIAEGRDASATIDSALLGLSLPSSMFSNDGDNEITGIHVSDGDPKKGGILGAKKPKPFNKDGKWRAFWTQQHGDNVTYELVRSDADRTAGYDDNDD
jgi:Alkaline phosphatase PhoX